MNNMDNLTINTLRFLAAEAIQKAKSGHPGLPLGAAPAAYTLWAKELKANPQTPTGMTETDLFFPQDTALHCCIPCCMCSATG